MAAIHKIIFRLLRRIRELFHAMPKDFLFPSVAGISRVVTLTGNRAFANDLLGTMVNLAAHNLSLASSAADGFFIVCGPGALVLTGDPDIVVAGDQAVMVAASAGGFKFIDNAFADIASLLAHASSTANPHGVTKEQIGAAPDYPRAIAVTGTLADGNEDPVVFPVMPVVSENHGYPSFSISGYTVESVILDYIDGSYEFQGWIASIPDSAARWESSTDTKDPTVISNWTPLGGATGTPVVTSSDVVTADSVRAAGAAMAGEVPVLGDVIPGTTAPVNAVAGVAATGSLTISGGLGQGQMFLINGVVYTHAPAFPSGPRDYFPAAPYGPTQVAAALAARINAWDGGGQDEYVTAVADGGTVNFTAREPGSAGNSITLQEFMDNTVVSGPTLTGGVDAVEATPAPPYVRVHGGFLYVLNEYGIWQKSALSAV